MYMYMYSRDIRPIVTFLRYLLVYSSAAVYTKRECYLLEKPFRVFGWMMYYTIHYSQLPISDANTRDDL